MNAVIEVRDLTKQYRQKLALDHVTFDIERDVITGFLGRNGAGKTTAMSIITAQNFASSGTVRVEGSAPYENPGVLSRMCFVREGQRYPEDAKPQHAFQAAKLFFPNWDEGYANKLVSEFGLPMRQTIKKLSRGQLSMVGIIIGLAARTPVTFFDEPYLGLDAVARQMFYDQLIADYAEHPRTIVLSSHLIDEVANLLERVLVIDDGRILLDESVEEAQSRAVRLTGDAEVIERVIGNREVIHRESLGRVAAVTLLGQLGETERQDAFRAGLDIAPVSLQQLIVRFTTQTSGTGGDLT